MTTITALPAAPNRGTDDAATFSSKADTFVAALQTFRTETNLVASETNTAQSGAVAASAAASSSAAVSAWNGTVTSYTLGQAVWSGVNFKTYRLSIASKAANGANTDPSVDTASWALVNGTGDVIATSVQTVTNKTLGNALGTAALPSYSFVGDTDTGAWSPSANAYAVSTSGVERMRIDSAGNVGIGTTSVPSGSRMTVTTSAISSQLVNFNSPSLPTTQNQRIGALGFGVDGETIVGSGARIQAFSSGAWTANVSNPTYLIFNTTPSGAVTPAERMRIDADGNVGIGITPTARLHVSGNALITGSATINGALALSPITLNAAATYTVLVSDSVVRCSVACTLTLPAAASFPGRILRVMNVTALAVISASANVIPLGSSTAGTALLPATAGKFVEIRNDGTTWYVTDSN